jgi:phospholipid-transporting ATPase
MYFPQAYHHVQEIQKYNIQDYRPRYVFPTHQKVIAWI